MSVVSSGAWQAVVRGGCLQREHHKARHLQTQITPNHVAHSGHYQVIVPVPSSCTKAVCRTRTCGMYISPPRRCLQSHAGWASGWVAGWFKAAVGSWEHRKRYVMSKFSEFRGDSTFSTGFLPCHLFRGHCILSHRSADHRSAVLELPLSDLCLLSVWAFPRESGGEPVHATEGQERHH